MSEENTIPAEQESAESVESNEPNEASKFSEAVGGANQKEESVSGDNEEKTSEESNSSEGKESSPAEKQHDYEKRYKDTQTALQQKSEAHKRVIEANVKLAEKNPDVLEDLAEADPSLADEVSQKIHGKSFKDYVSDQKLEGMKDEDPDRYSQEVRLRELERDKQEQIDRDRAEFYKSKGIQENEFDLKYKKVQEQVELLNPEFVKKNPVRALEMAHLIAFPSNANPDDQKKVENLAGNTSKSGGGSTSTIDHGAPTKSPEAQAFSDKMTELTGK